MTDFVRRLVSGDKARFKDEKLDLELGEPRTKFTTSPKRNLSLNLDETSMALASSKISSTSRIG